MLYGSISECSSSNRMFSEDGSTTLMSNRNKKFKESKKESMPSKKLIKPVKP
jgi:hypothetical protein